MSRQNIGSPRIYINMLEYLSRSGLDSILFSEYYTGFDNTRVFSMLRNLSYSDASNVINLSKIWPEKFHSTNDEGYFIDRRVKLNFGLPSSLILGDQSYIAFLNHNFALTKLSYRLHRGGEYGAWNVPTDYNIINTELGGGAAHIPQTGAMIQPSYNGFSINTFTSTNLISPSIDIEFNSELIANEQLDNHIMLGGMALGFYYDFPNSADISLSQKRKYNYKSFMTQDGRSLTNSQSLGKRRWQFGGEWEIGHSNSRAYDFHQSPTGRREWTMNFTHISTEDIMSKNEMFSSYFSYNGNQSSDSIPSYEESVDGDYNYDSSLDEYHFNSNTVYNNNDFTKVMNFTMGGSIPFILQLDKNNGNQDQFCMARIKQDSFEFNLVANGEYDISITIEEVM